MERYFDYAATSPVFPESIETFKNITSKFFGNPSSQHNFGLKARTIFDESKNKFLKLLGIDNAEIILTSGGTESNNQVLNAILKTYNDSKIIISNDTHASSWFITDKYQDRVDILKISSTGQIKKEYIEKVLKPEHILVSILQANNETGVIQEDLNDIIEICRMNGKLIHIDGVQAVGHIPLRIKNFKNVFYTFSSHKFGSMRGCGGIITSSQDKLYPLIFGGHQELGLRAGTENIAAFISATKALEISIKKMCDVKDKLFIYSKYIIEKIKKAFPAVTINSSCTGLPGLVSFSIPGVSGSILVTEMAMQGFDISSGSACHSGSSTPSRIIRAMGRDRKSAFGTIRISMGYNTEEKYVTELVKYLIINITRQLEA